MNREKIISLARQCNQDSIRATKNRPYGIYELTEDAIVAFYHAAIADFLKSSGQYVTNDATREACIKQAKFEAFEAAIDFILHKHYDDPYCLAAAIREMAKEKQNAD